eukprot:s7087_g2.t1
MHWCQVIAALAATAGLAGVGRIGASSAWDRWQTADGTVETFCSDVVEVKTCHSKCGHDGACHRACPMPKDADLQTKLASKMECHDKCGADRECHRACGCPFQQLHDKCPMLEHFHHHHHHGWHHDWHPAVVQTAFCSDVVEVKMCHAKCGHDGACHRACPMPKDADLQTKLTIKMECHDKCGADRECHRACGCPFQQLQDKCPMLEHFHHHHHHGWHHDWHPAVVQTAFCSDVVECHDKCGADRECHRACGCPFQQLHDKCPMLEHFHHHHHHGWHHDWHPAVVQTAFCSDVVEVKMCHAKCGHDGACHKACPMPKDVDLQAKLASKMECHDKCGADRECHHACGCPFQQLQDKCPILSVQAGELQKPHMLPTIHM